MEEQKKVILTGSLVIIGVALVVVVYYFFIRERAKEALPVPEVVEEQAVQVPEEESVAGEEAGEPLQVELDKSDELIRGLAEGLSTHQKMAPWLNSKELIRRFTAAVDNIANGLSPRPQIDFFTPEGEFKVKVRNRRYYADPAGYKRYDIVAEVFSSLDTVQTVALYRRTKPLIQEAYGELGYPDEDFDGALFGAIVELLKVPVVRGDMLLERKVISYAIADPGLESLSEAQKYLLRMGPDNIQKIQDKLRELASALGVPENILPRPKVYLPVKRTP